MENVLYKTKVNKKTVLLLCSLIAVVFLLLFLVVNAQREQLQRNFSYAYSIWIGNYKEGTFKMDGTTVLITYPDGGYDEFEYDAEKDELNLAGIELMTFVKEK